jgi:phosphoglycolate phosphatase-like HAD superfamily hydrolase
MRFTADLVLVDIDNTLSAGDILAPAPPGALLFGNRLLEIISRHVAAARGLPQDEADRAMRRFIDELIWWDYPDFLAEFDLDATRVWPELVACHAAHIRPREDAVAMVHALHAAGYPLAIASNNPLTGCQLKLQAVGLGDGHASAWFPRIHGSNNLRGQKFAPAWWRRCLAHLALPPERVVIVGDHPRDDAAIPAQVGLRQAILVDRALPTATATRDGVPVVRDLRQVPALLTR